MATAIPLMEPPAAEAVRQHGPVNRIMSAGLETALERFDDPELLEGGKVNLIALDAIVERSGARWPARRDQVYSHVERMLERHLGYEGYFLRISEADFLICQPELGRFAGQAACVRYLREVLTHFLGEAHLGDLGVHQVTRIDPACLEASRLDPGHVEREAGAEPAHAQEQAPEGRGEAGPCWTPISPSPDVLASDGRSVRISCALEPVFELKGYARIGFRMRRTVIVQETGEVLSPAAVGRLPRTDILRIDMAAAQRGLDRLRAEPATQRSPTLILPVSCITLSHQRGRADILAVLEEARQLVGQGVICEICDIDGVPQGALLNAAALVRPHCLFVVGRLHAPSAGSAAALRGAGLQAISFECPGDLGEAEFMGWAKAAIGAAKQVAKSVLVYRAPSNRHAAMAGLLNATHASVMAN